MFYGYDFMYFAYVLCAKHIIQSARNIHYKKANKKPFHLLTYDFAKATTTIVFHKHTKK